MSTNHLNPILFHSYCFPQSLSLFTTGFCIYPPDLWSLKWQLNREQPYTLFCEHLMKPVGVGYPLVFLLLFPHLTFSTRQKEEFCSKFGRCSEWPINHLYCLDKGLFSNVTYYTRTLPNSFSRRIHVDLP